MRETKADRRARALARKWREEQGLPPEDEGRDRFHGKDLNGILDELEKDNWGDHLFGGTGRTWRGDDE